VGREEWKKDKMDQARMSERDSSTAKQSAAEVFLGVLAHAESVEEL